LSLHQDDWIKEKGFETSRDGPELRNNDSYTVLFKETINSGGKAVSNFLIRPLLNEVSTELKKTMRDKFANEPKLEQAQSRRSICRRCLHRFNPGERRLLFKYRPFQKEGVFAEAGPIYIHENECQPDAEILKSYPNEFRELPLLLRAYTKEDGQVDSKLIKDGDAEMLIDEFFARPEVAYIHLRDGESGCYYARIERDA
jgi:hypothetical protein